MQNFSKMLQRLIDVFGSRRHLNDVLRFVPVLILVLGGGGGYYGHSRWGYGGGAGIGLGTILLILLIAYMLGGFR